MESDEEKLEKYLYEQRMKGLATPVYRKLEVVEPESEQDKPEIIDTHSPDCDSYMGGICNCGLE